MNQIDYRAHPNVGQMRDQGDEAEGPLPAESRDHPNSGTPVAPPADLTIMSFDEPDELPEYNLMSRGIGANIRGWSPDQSTGSWDL